ncbi:MAG: type II toxin-antitoxin system VapC family toxin [Ignavibacteria bacterium]|jgi:tRNA(fMet)-specific endonuclease VapC|nr:type II toxin-antitoxin system VapC family toxin [Ignavibacteria bacterium]
MKYLLDTDICIYTIKKSPNKVFKRLSACKVGDVGISAITYSELSYGVSYSRKPDQNRIALHEFLAPLEILDYQAEVAPVYGALRAELRKSGKMFGPLDMLIAAQALHMNCVLVTNNTKEFKRVKGLRVENWAA